MSENSLPAVPTNPGRRRRPASTDRALVPIEKASFAPRPEQPQTEGIAADAPPAPRPAVSGFFADVGGTTALLADALSASAQRGASAYQLDPLRLGPVLFDVATHMVRRPSSIFEAQATLARTSLDLWRAGWETLLGPSAAEQPHAKDRRFNDPAWEHPLFDLTRRVYIVASDCAEQLAKNTNLSDPLEKRRLEFFTKAAVDALAPSNFFLSNPVALREAMHSRGASLLRGLQNFAADLKRGGGRLSISQTDTAQFEVGVNVATSPGKVVFRNELFELLQFSPTTEQVYETPLLLITPWINKYYIVDLQAENSLVRWLTRQGHTVFVTSWVNPDPSHADKSFEDYMRQGVLTAISKAMEQTGQAEVNAVGYCIGGTMLGATMAYLEAVGIKSPIRSATFFAAQQDFSQAGDLQLLSQEGWLQDVERQMDAAGGVLPGHAMSDAFNHLRANDLVWSFFVSNYLLGKAPKPFDLLFWNADATRMPKRLHLWYLREFYQQNKFSRGELMLDGAAVDLRKVETPVYVQAAKEDHIAPFASVYRGARLFGGPSTFVLAGSGHIAGVINPPASGKYQHWVRPDLPETADEWFADAVEHPGSWWPHWAGWLAERSGSLTAARDPGAGPLPPLGEAPGDYVLVRC